MESNDESAGETCAENMVVGRERRCEVGQFSELSTVGALTSASDSFSENAAGKASLKTSNASAPEDNVARSKSEVQRVPEGQDDCLSCVSGTDEHANRKLGSDDIKIKYDRQRRSNRESSNNVPPMSSPTGLFSQKSGLVEIPLPQITDAAAELLTVKNTSHGKCMSHEPNSRDVEDDKPSGKKDKLLEGSTEQLDSVPPRGIELDVVCGDPPTVAQNSSRKNDDMEVEVHSIDETDDSDIVEQDVKVCDICGDAGREDLLAVCCQCSDGAEHTYCMREMLDKVPEGDWMCEECKSVEQVRNEKHAKVGRVDENEKNNSSGQASSEYMNSSDAEGQRMKGYKKNPGKRLRDDADGDVSSVMKKPALESIIGSPKTSGSTKTAALSREKSLKSIDKSRLQSPHHFTSDTLPVNDTTSASSASDPRVQNFRGIFSKSNSFNSLNSKPKVKLVDQVVIQRQKSAREHGSFRLKEGLARPMGKSMSFKSTNSNRAESKTKMLSPRPSQIQDRRNTENAKERSTFERQRSLRTELNSTSASLSSTSKVDKRPASRGDFPSPNTVPNHHETKSVQGDGKSAALSRSSSLTVRRSADLSSSSGEFKRLSAHGHNLGVSSANGVNNSDHKSSLKEDSSPCSVVGETPTVNTNGAVPDNLSRPKDLTNSDERAREISGSRFSQTSAKSCRPESDNIRAAIEAAVLRKPGVYRKHRACGQSDDSSAPNMGSESAPHQVRASSSAGKKKLHSDVELPERPIVSRSLNADSIKQETLDNVQVPLEGLASGGGDGVPSSKIALSNFPEAIPFSLKCVAIPEHEFIWQGSFEICRSGIFDIRHGMQAHLSTCASPKVIEAVNHLQNRIVLYEVPRMSTWPVQFQEHGVREDNIALFFFAKDLESYDNVYRVLLDNMMKNDLALKGNVNGVELLIFPSNHLPDNSQRWNMFFFLWGVFRGKKQNSLQHLPASLNKFCATRDVPPAIMSLPENRCSFRPMTEDSPASSNAAATLEVPASENLCSLLSSKDVRGDCGVSVSSLDRLESSQHSSSLAAAQSDSAKQCHEMRDASQEKEISSSCSPLMPTRSSSCSWRQQTLMQLDTPLDEQKLLHNSSGSATGTREEVVDEGTIKNKAGNQDQVKSRRDAIDLCTVGGAPLEEHRDAIDINMEDNSRWLFKHKERTDPSVSCVVDPTLYAGTSQVSLAIRDEPCGILERNQRHEGCLETVGPNCNESTADKFIFPLELQPVKGIDGSTPWRMHQLEQDRVNDLTPNLELALGAERKSPTQGIRPLLMSKVDEKVNQDCILDKAGTKGEEDVSASLSLSLSFPFPDKEECMKPDSKTEPQLVAERGNVDASMFLFGRLRDK